MSFEYVARVKSQATLLQDWLREVPFQAFVTIRPFRATSLDTLKAVIQDFQRASEMMFRTPLSYVISYERQPVWNIHLLIAGSRKLDLLWMESYLNSKIENVQVQPYESYKNGISYVLKAADCDDGSTWEMSDHMFLFLPKQPGENRKHRIARKLHDKRLFLP
jgi:hypothetical protein